MKALAWAAGIVGLWLTLQGIIDAVDRHGDDQATLAQALRDSCMPRGGETAVIVSDGTRAHCRIYSTASRSPGRVPMLISTAVVEGDL